MEAHINSILKLQQTFFNEGNTRNISKRKTVLKDLKKEIENREQDIAKAIYNDFKKPEFEVLLTETKIVLSDLKDAIRNIHKWTKPKRVNPSLLNFPSAAKIIKEPYGRVLIMSPWNYPFQLALSPLIGAVAAGNTVVLKPSELTPNTSKIISEIILKVFPKEYVTVVEGDKIIAQTLLEKKWDYIFFTGSPHVGKIVYQSAAKYLTPVTLELGGKNPCIVDEKINIKLAAKRIVWGKFINGGQTCIAPDYILVDSKIKTQLIEVLKQEIINAYTKNPEESKDYVHIVNENHTNRLKNLLSGQEILFGGVSYGKNSLAPTLVNEPSLESPLMQEEIFGPILPIISYKNEEEIKSVITKYEKPLSLYVFSKRSAFAQKIINEFSFGGGAINDTVVHFVNKKLPFGGVGNSGLGAYHGKLTFNTFSHSKPIVNRGTWLDIPLRYAPYAKKTKWAGMLERFM
ncbi:aldehyde dehydrogenase [Galbibacter sp. PAP.153]|uniref:aldehyde dehydrogenase n=1 Tax=Galbibacter sp. PAP.153 TaxID=3104623 RepID=UPI00300ADADE